MTKKPILATKWTCTGCMACVDICTPKALVPIEEIDGHLYVKWEKESCISCEACTKVCPIVNKYSFRNDLKHSKPYAGWAKNDSLRMKSSSGGAFAAIAEFFLLKGWYVAGAVQDDLSVKHLITNKIEDLEKLQNSKYQQGQLAGIYKQARFILTKGNKLLFSGTSCQVAGLYSFLGEKKYLKNLYTIDLVCSGFTSILPLRTFLRNEPYQIESISYRNKENGWVNNEGEIVCQSITAYTSDRTIDYGKNIIYSAFFSHLTIRNSCINCKFAFLHRKSDITLADFWGDKDFPNEHFKGISAIVSHSIKGYELLNNSKVIFYPTEWEKILSKNYRLVVGRIRFYKYHPIRLLYPFIFKHCSYKFIKKLFDGKQRNILWFPYRIMYSIIYRISVYYLKMDFNRNLSNSF